MGWGWGWGSYILTKLPIDKTVWYSARANIGLSPPLSKSVGGIATASGLQHGTQVLQYLVDTGRTAARHPKTTSATCAATISRAATPAIHVRRCQIPSYFELPNTQPHVGRLMTRPCASVERDSPRNHRVAQFARSHVFAPCPAFPFKPYQCSIRQRWDVEAPLLRQ